MVTVRFFPADRELIEPMLCKYDSNLITYTFDYNRIMQVIFKDDDDALMFMIEASEYKPKSKKQ